MGLAGFSATAMVDIALVITMAEGVALWIYRLRTGNGIPVKDFTANLFAGMMLMLTLRMHMAGWSWMVTTGLLAGAGVFHALDVRRRWRHAGRQPGNIKQPS